MSLLATKAQIRDAGMVRFVSQPMVSEALEAAGAALDTDDPDAVRAALVLLLSILTPFQDSPG